MTDWEIIVALLGLTCITVVTRALFLLSERPIPLPPLLEQGLRYAPLAALAAIVAPGVFADGAGHLTASWTDPRWPGAVLGALWFAWRRDILGTILVGTGTLLFLRLGAGWSP